MLSVAVLLIVAAYHSAEAEPMLWGSRIIGTPLGTSPLMYFHLPREILITTLRKDNESPLIDIRNGSCYVGEEVLGSPCQMDGDGANITLNDVSKEEALQIWSKNGLFSTAIFVPYCAFQKPVEGEVDLRTSFPLSRFRKGKRDVDVKFAVGGAYNESLVSFILNGKYMCTWDGIALRRPVLPICSDLTRDLESNLRVFDLHFIRSDSQKKTRFEWLGPRIRLAVTVDWEQEGDSPEIAACKAYQSQTEPGLPPSKSTHARPTTTLAANAMLASLLMARLS